MRPLHIAFVALIATASSFAGISGARAVSVNGLSEERSFGRQTAFCSPGAWTQECKILEARKPMKRKKKDKKKEP